MGCGNENEGGNEDGVGMECGNEYGVIMGCGKEYGVSMRAIRAKFWIGMSLGAQKRSGTAFSA